MRIIDKTFLVFIFVLSPFLLLNAQVGTYEEGYIINKQGEKVDCLIKMYNPESIVTKVNRDTKKVVYYPKDIKGFVIGTNHYIVLRNVKAKMDNNLFADNYKEAFAKIEVTGRINLYSLLMQGLRGNSFVYETVYLIEKTGEQEVIQVPKNKKKMYELVCKLTNDYPDLCSDMINKKLKYYELSNLIIRYNNFQPSISIE